MPQFPKKSNSNGGLARLYFVGPPWLIELMKQVYGDAIDYIVQQKI